MTTPSLDEIAARLVEGFGLADSELEDSCSRLDGFQIGERSVLKVARQTKDAAEAIHYLSRFTFPATRHVLIAIDDCTAFLNNSKNGSDFADYAFHFAPRVGTRVARVLNKSARIWKNGAEKEVLGYEARLLEVYGPHGDLLRSVVCIDDGGRWTFLSEGKAHAIEETFDYSARRKKDRFTENNLRALVSAFGLPWLAADRFLSAREYVLVAENYASQEWARKMEERACSFEQLNDPAYGYYERGLGWAEHMQSHAESAIADLERAIRLNPNYGPLAAPYLEMAWMEIVRRRVDN